MTADQYKQARLMLGLSAKQLAERLGVSFGTIYNRESGKTATIPQEAVIAITQLIKKSKLK
jgi:transcriptional regulator with XRE-family HTH domain